MKFNYIFGNPPFQDSQNRKKTQHKLWIEFTKKFFLFHLHEKGEMFWVTPSSWGSPSNKIFKLFREYDVKYLNLDIGRYFSNIGSTFSYSHIQQTRSKNNRTRVKRLGSEFDLEINEKVKYFPMDFCNESISIHKKVMFDPPIKCEVKFDYVTCHNVIRHAKSTLLKKINKARNDLESLKPSPARDRKKEKLREYEDNLKTCVITLSEERTTEHIHPVLHTNRKTWYSSVRQDFANKKKVMWTRSGYTKPFYDDGVLGCTDMGYYILVNSSQEGYRLEKFLTSPLMSYIFRTAKWSGFGNEIVFSSIPKIDLSKDMDDKDYYNLFSLSPDEITYLDSYGNKKKKNSNPGKKAEVKKEERKKILGEVYTPKELVLEMLDLLGDGKWRDPSSTFADPACGTGNFLVEIVKRKMKAGLTPLEAARTTFGIDIMQDNVDECRTRIFAAVRDSMDLDDHQSIIQVIKDNVRMGDALRFELEDIFSRTPSLDLQNFRKIKTSRRNEL